MPVVVHGEVDSSALDAMESSLVTSLARYGSHVMLADYRTYTKLKYGIVAGGMFSNYDTGILTSCWPLLLGGPLCGSPSEGCW